MSLRHGLRAVGDELAVLHVHAHRVAIADLAIEQLLGQLVLDLSLDESLERPGAERRVVTLERERADRVIAELQRDVAFE